jgi:hypothetical protein
MTAYRNELKLEVRVNGKPVVLNNDYQLRQESSPGQPDKFVIELTTI